MKRLLLLLTFPLLYCVASAQNAKDFYDKSKQKLEAGKFLDALELIDKAIALNKNDIWNYLLKSEIEMELRQVDEAFTDIQQAIKIKPDESEPYNRLGSFYSVTGQKDSAVLSYNDAMKHAKNDTILNSLISNRGTTYLGYMDWELAIKDFEQVLNFDSNNIVVLNNISTAYKKTNQTDKAIRSLEKIIQLDSTFIGPYINLGMIYTESDEFEKAMNYFNSALKIDSSVGVIWNNRGFLWYKMKNYDRAIVDINKSLTLYSSNSYAYKNRALAYIALGKITEGCKDLDAADYYGYSKHYGTEVDELKTKYCK